MRNPVPPSKAAIRGLWYRLLGVDPRPLPAFEDEARQRFDEEYEAILAEMSATLPVARLGPRGLAGAGWRGRERRRYARTA